MIEKESSLLEQIENIVKNEGQNTFWRKKAVLIRITILATCLLIICYISYKVFYSVNINSHGEIKKDNYTNISAEIYVDLSGAVNKPGVYKLDPNTRLFMLIDKAGGLNFEADREFVARNYNLSVPLSDQQKIYIPTVNDVQIKLVAENQKVVSAELDQMINSKNIVHKDDLKKGTINGNTVSINNDDISSLMALPGVGEVTAQRIISSRPHNTIESLVEKGLIKQSLFEKIRSQITP